MSEQEKKSAFEEKEKFGSESRSDVSVVELPTGFYDPDKDELVKEVELKEITGEEEDMLAGKGMSAYQRMHNLMVNCTTRIGSYHNRDKVDEIVKSLVSNDRFFLVYKIREISLGNLYKFSAPCPSCGDDKVRMIDLRDIVVPSLENPKQRSYNGHLPKSGLSYRWVVQNGKTEERAQRTVKNAGNNLFSALILQRLQELDDKPATIQTVKKLSAKDRAFLRAEFEKVEGVLDNEIIVDCDACGHTFNLEADIGQKEFFFPTL